MNTSKLNPRMTIIVVFAFLFILALFISPNAPEEDVAAEPTESAAPVIAKPPAPVSSAAAVWAADEPIEAPQASPTPTPEPQPPAPAAAIPQVAPDPPPQGPDFPQNK